MQNDPAPSFLRPPPERGVPLAWWLVGLLVSGVLALQLLRLSGVATPPSEPAVAPPPSPPAASIARPSPPPAAPAQPAPRATPIGPGETIVTRCVEGGRTSFTDGDCAPGAQASELRVQRNLNLADGAAHLPRARPQRPPPGQQMASSGSGAAPHGGLDRRSECQALAQRIDQLDAQARQPQSGQMQDWIAARRHEVRNRQFQLRC